MKYTVDLNDRPVYLQIYRQLRADIVGGAFAYGSKLPSKRLLAEELGVSTITTEHAYNLLCEEGYAQARERSGYFVVFRRSDGFAAARRIFCILRHIEASRRESRRPPRRDMNISAGLHRATDSLWSRTTTPSFRSRRSLRTRFLCSPTATM